MITITSTFTADPIRNQLESLLKKFTQQRIDFFYSQTFQQLILPTSELNTNDTGLNVILIRLFDLFDIQSKAHAVSEKITDLTTAFQTAQKHMKVPLLVISTPNEYKNLDDKLFFESIEKILQTNLESYKNIFFINSQQTVNDDNSKYLFDNFSEKHGHIPYSFDFYHSLATIIARKYSLISRKPYKVIVLDCDGTLWDGIIEEDGLAGIKIDNHHTAFYQFIIECYKSGFLICLCSKNSEESVLAVFENHDNMQLSIQKHICTYRINWEAKSKNIQSIATELDLGLDSFIFIDDNKIECAEVKAEIPEILSIELPKNNHDRMCYLKNIWAFDYLNTGNEDKNRTQFYQTNKLRKQVKDNSTSYAEFLKYLNIKTTISYAKCKDFDRIFQLSQRTNQFNIFPNSMSALEFDKSIKTKQPHCLTIHVCDKFGDYGLVGVLVYDISENTLFIKSFFLSCRILGRGIEYEILKYLSQIAQNNEVDFIQIAFSVTQRNMPAINFLKKIAGKINLEHQTEFVLSVQEIQQIALTPHEIERPTQSTTVKKTKESRFSNDYMLEIALQSITKEKKYKSHCKHAETSEIIKSNLIELFNRHNIILAKHDIPFTYLGLDSLKSVLIASDIYRIYQIAINPFELLEDKLSLNTLLKRLSNEIKSEKSFVKISHDIHQIPLSYPQKRLWYDEKLSGFTNKNNMFVAYKVDSHIEIDVLEQAFIELIERHDVLRCTFFEINDEPFIKLHSLSDINFKLHHLQDPNTSSEVQFINDLKYKPFDLTQAPLLRVGIITKTDGKKNTLLIGIHHIIHDGWSLSILLHELSILYEAYLKKISTPLIEKAPSFIEFSSWQNKYICSDTLLKQKKFWAKFLYKLPKLELIYDKPRQESDGKTVAKRIHFKIDAATTKKLKTIAQNNHVTLYELLISSFALLLSHYSNQNDISFVTAFSGRHQIFSSKTIGFFVNLALVRLNIDPTDSLAQMLHNSKKILLEIIKNQDLPFNEVLQITGDNVSSKMHAFSQAGFVFQNYPTPALILNGKKCDRILSDDPAELLYDACQECRFGNIVCFMQEFKSNLHGLFEYNTRLFNERTIKHIMLAFKTLLKNISKNPIGPAAHIGIVNEHQQKMLFNRWGKSSHTLLHDKGLISHFLEQVINEPNSIAVQHHHITITYIELNKQSDYLAYRLKQSGVQFETPIGIFLDKTIEYIVAILAIVKSGGCYVPIEKDQPVARINYIINDIPLSHIISDHEGTHYIKEKIKQPLLVIDIHEKNVSTEFISPILKNEKINQLAYIMYTSGSTGKPKGVMIEQAGILRLVKSTNYIKIETKDRVAQTSSITFDAATFEIWGALLNGARLIIGDKQTLLDPISFQKFLDNEKISLLFLTTQLFHSYSHSMPKMFATLKYLVIGGEALLADSVKSVFKEHRHPKFIINGYGPTENTTFSTTYLIKNSKDILNPLPIGKPINGTEAYVLNKFLNSVPVGAPGKLYLAGSGLARGYVNLNSMNNQKFIRHLNKKLYNTGDIVVWQEDGNIRYIGREDNQIKINGYRIELDEIEANIKTHPLIEQSIVLIKHADHQKQLAAYIQLKDNHELAKINLYHYLKLTLPKYMIPTLYYQVQDIPITQTGKVDKNMLVISNINPITYTEYESPSTALHNDIAIIYSQILKIDAHTIGINTEFFDLGGNSISALTLIHTINSKFGVKINFSELYERSTIKLLSEHIEIRLKHSPSTLNLSSRHVNKNSLKKIKHGHSKNTPIVFMHPIGGTGFCYLDLIKLLPNEQPCYIIQDPSIDADQILFDDISSMAQHYNTLLLDYFQSTKFILAGYSFGGMLSIEMVYQLEQKKLDNTIKCIIAFDTWIVSNFMNTKAKEALKQSILQQYQRIETNLTQENIDPKPWMELYYFRLQELGFTYIPPKINKDIVLFKALQQSGEFAAMNDHANYLGSHTSKAIDIHMVPGSHDSILQQPHVKHISDIIVSFVNPIID